MSQQLCSHLWHFKTSQYQNKQKKNPREKELCVQVQLYNV